MKLSIIIVNWNVKDLLKECLGSIFTFAPSTSFEIFVVDNASSDSSAEMVSVDFPNVTLITNTENRGFAYACNQAIRQSTGEYVLLLNPDCHLTEGTIDKTLHFLDSHPDHSITFNQTLSAIPFVKSAELGVSGLSRCYDGFRVMRFAKMQGGKAVHFTNQEMLEFGYSIEQYKLMAELNENGSIEINGEKVSDYPGIVRASLRTGIESPVKFLESSVLEFSEMLEERAEFVRQAWNDVLQNGVITFPNDSSEENIYQANGRWEVWSSPSSDVDRKNKYSYFTQRLKSMLENFGNSQICDYSGFSSRKALAEFLIKRKEELFLEKGIVYENSSGKSFRLALSDIESRLFDMSFDPNHPPELRWGAPENSEERQGMKLFKTPLRTGESLDALTAYNLEKGLRYYPVRQATPTSLNLEANPKTPPFELFNKVLASYLAP